MKLYDQLAQNLGAQIRAKVYQHGDKLPSVRSMAKQRDVSVSTVLAAYNQLEDQGLIEVRPKSGYYVRALKADSLERPTLKQKMLPPKTITSSSLVMDVMRDSKLEGCVSLGAAVPAGDLPIVQEMQKTFTRLMRTKQFLGIGYDSTKGDAQLRTQIAKHSLASGLMVDADSIVVTAGCQGAIGLCLRALCEKGDIVAVESPAYYGLLQLIESSGLKALEIPSDAERGMSIDALRLAMEQWPVKVILTVSSFSNPLGSLIPDAQKQAMLDLAKDYDVPIIEDDIYGDLHFGDVRPRSIKSFDTDGRVLLCSSASKILDPQLGLGWVIPGRYLEQIEYERFLNNTGLFLLPQRVLSETLSKASFQRHLRLARTTYEQRRDTLIDLVAEYFPKGTRITRPQGGFVAWLQLPAMVDSAELYQMAKKSGVIIAPGAIFSSNPQKFRHYVRVSYANDWNNERKQAIKTLASLTHGLS